jgi:hypothetical protein
MKNVNDMTRAQAERAIAQGANPELFEGHKNYHVRYKALRKQGKLAGGNPDLMLDLAKRVRPNHTARLDAFFASLAKVFALKAE